MGRGESKGVIFGGGSMNYWQGDKICLRAMEESDADFFYETLQDMEIQKTNPI